MHACIIHTYTHTYTRTHVHIRTQLSGGSGNSTAPRKFISDIKTEGLGHGSRTDFFTMRCWVRNP